MQTEKRKIYTTWKCVKDKKLLMGYIRTTSSKIMGPDIRDVIFSFTDRESICLCVSSINDKRNIVSDKEFKKLFVVEPTEVIQRNGQYVERNPIMSELIGNEMMFELISKNTI